MKQCTKCKELRPLNAFYFNNRKTRKSEYESRCKTCRNDINRRRLNQKRKTNLEFYREKEKLRQRKWRAKDPQRNKEYEKKYYRRAKSAVFNHYGNNDPKCACCGEKQMEFLCIDHINGGGSQQRKVLKRGNIYHWLKMTKFPKGYQVLCHNCNAGKSIYGICPHIRK